MPIFTLRSTLPVSADALAAWHERPGALRRLLPPWQPVSLVSASGGVRDGARVDLALGPRAFGLRWRAVHSGYLAGREFADEQVSGPFRRWRHVHRFVPADPGASELVDEIEWELPGGSLGALAESPVEASLARMFAWRHARTRADLERHAAFGARPRLRIALSGASGHVGTQLAAFLSCGGHEVLRFVRRAPGTGELRWDPARGELDAGALEGVDAVVHLSGEPIAGRWTPERRHAIRESRVASTRLVAETLARAARGPRALICASAIGFYGNRGDEVLDESSAAGAGFLADVCREWEAAAAPARSAGIRVAHARLGVVLGAGGGVLARLRAPFAFGLGGKLGDGRQWLSWIGLDDAIGALHHLVWTESAAGPINLTAPEPVTNAEFTRALARVLRRPALLPVPAGLVRAALGEMGQALLLDGARVLPRALEASGFRFRTPTLEAALRDELGRPSA
jgi:uncharacterized protein (TIGR01777 family)